MIATNMIQLPWYRTASHCSFLLYQAVSFASSNSGVYVFLMCQFSQNPISQVAESKVAQLTQQRTDLQQDIEALQESKVSNLLTDSSHLDAN